jgi:signal peptidase II
MSESRKLYVGALLATLAFDQATKLWLYFVVDIQARQPIAVAPFLDLILVWNQGISYGLFQQSTEVGRWALTLFKLAAAVGLTIWAWRSGDRLLSMALGLIAGGAIGNAIDRILYGAVLDFVHLHWGRFSWYVFNVADAAIVAGVALLMYDSLRPGRSPAPEKPRSP